jgi:GGDEF domain-containing protein
MMISIRKYLDSRPEHVIDALLRTTHLLLEGLERHAVKPDAAEYERFCTDMQRLREGLTRETAAQEILVAAGQALKTLEEYNARAARHVRSQCDDLQNMVGMLTKTMAAISSGSQGTISRLQNIEGQLQKASMLEDFHAVKIRMAECLDVLSTEIVRTRTESARNVSEMHSVVERLRVRPLGAAEQPRRLDRLTNLPERAAAEETLSMTVKEGRPVFAAVFVVDRLDLINARFGRSAGDEMLAFFAQHVQQGLAEADRLFRWTGPALLGILNRDESLASVREAMSRLLSKRLTKSTTVDNRSVLLSVPAKWMVFAAMEVRPLPQLIKSIDVFVHGEPPDGKPAAP